jgi:lysocardiolipin and lysophospholipid acyltransferase
VTGDDLINDRKRSLIILNHRTRMDWMYIWMLHSRYEILKQLKIVLKAQLKHVPFIGKFEFVFLFIGEYSFS